LPASRKECWTSRDWPRRARRLPHRTRPRSDHPWDRRGCARKAASARPPPQAAVLLVPGVGVGRPRVHGRRARGPPILRRRASRQPLLRRQGPCPPASCRLVLCPLRPRPPAPLPLVRRPAAPLPLLPRPAAPLPLVPRRRLAPPVPGIPRTCSHAAAPPDVLGEWAARNAHTCRTSLHRCALGRAQSAPAAGPYCPSDRCPSAGRPVRCPSRPDVGHRATARRCRPFPRPPAPSASYASAGPTPDGAAPPADAASGRRTGRPVP